MIWQKNVVDILSGQYASSHIKHNSKFCCQLCSSNLAPRNFRIFSILKKEIHGRKFNGDCEVCNVVEAFFKAVLEEEIRKTIHIKWPERECISSFRWSVFWKIFKNFLIIMSMRITTFVLERSIFFLNAVGRSLCTVI